MSRSIEEEKLWQDYVSRTTLSERVNDLLFAYSLKKELDAFKSKDKADVWEDAVPTGKPQSIPGYLVEYDDDK